MTQAPTDTLDLSRCADEPILTTGSIQPHGFMLTLSSAARRRSTASNSRISRLSQAWTRTSKWAPLPAVIVPI